MARLHGAPLQPVGDEQGARLAVGDVYIALVIGVLEAELETRECAHVDLAVGIGVHVELIVIVHELVV